MKRVAFGVALLVCLQLVAWWVYDRVESGRSAASATPLELDPVSGPAYALDVALAQPDGTSMQLRDGVGKVIVLHFWASWCLPCRDELPTLLELRRSHGDELEVVLVTVDEGWPPVQQFFAGEIPAGVVLDSSGALRQAYGASTLPATWVIDSSGLLRARATGAHDWTHAGAQLRNLPGS